jgi:hypothetical protein
VAGCAAHPAPWQAPPPGPAPARRLRPAPTGGPSGPPQPGPTACCTRRARACRVRRGGGGVWGRATGGRASPPCPPLFARQAAAPRQRRGQREARATHRPRAFCRNLSLGQVLGKTWASAMSCTSPSTTSFPRSLSSSTTHFCAAARAGALPRSTHWPRWRTRQAACRSGEACGGWQEGAQWCTEVRATAAADAAGGPWWLSSASGRARERCPLMNVNTAAAPLA